MIGERLLALRTDADMTQDELAAALSINKHSISSYEREKSEPPDDIKIAIARYFNVSVDYLIGLIDYPAPLDGRRAIRLPDGFPEKCIPELLNYAEYLTQKEER